MASNLVVGNCTDKFYYAIVHSYLEVCTWMDLKQCKWHKQCEKCKVEDFQLESCVICKNIWTLLLGKVWQWQFSEETLLWSISWENFGSLLALPLYNLPQALRFHFPLSGSYVRLLLYTFSRTKRKPLTGRLSRLSKSAAPSSSTVVTTPTKIW